ncbi:MAG TPA: polymer-forming cytoskeletal protein, partial [Gemmatimonadales bacterium]
EARLRSALQPINGELRLTVAGGTARQGNFVLASQDMIEGPLLIVDGNADVYGHLQGNLVTVKGDVILHPGGLVSGDVLTLGGALRDEGGEVGGEVRTLKSTNVLTPINKTETPALGPLQSVLRRVAGVLGVFLTLAVLGFGLVMFGRQNLETVSDTVSHSFGRAFITGLLGQILLLPTFGMLVVGLILSVAGILLLPFAIAVFAMLAVVAVVGGYLAVAHAMGETYTRRRMALGVVIGSPNSYRYVLVGLLALASVWAAWALFGWVPVAGSIIWGAAFFVTWLLGTTGFGAALLSRAGIKENFAGRLLPPEALTDEYLWATPQFGVPAGRRPGTRTPTRGV